MAAKTSAEQDAYVAGFMAARGYYGRLDTEIDIHHGAECAKVQGPYNCTCREAEQLAEARRHAAAWEASEYRARGYRNRPEPIVQTLEMRTAVWLPDRQWEVDVRDVNGRRVVALQLTAEQAWYALQGGAVQARGQVYR